MVEHNIDWDDEEAPSIRTISGWLALSEDAPCRVCKSPDHGALQVQPFTFACPLDIKLPADPVFLSRDGKQIGTIQDKGDGYFEIQVDDDQEWERLKRWSKPNTMGFSMSSTVKVCPYCGAVDGFFREGGFNRCNACGRPGQ